MSPSRSCTFQMRRLPAARLGLLAAIALSTIPPFSTASAVGPNDRRLNNARTGIALEAPAGWTLSQHTGYSHTIALLLHPDGSRISVTAASTTARDASALLKQNSGGFTAQGLVATQVQVTMGRGEVAVDLSGAGRTDKLRQLYIVRAVPLGRQAIVLTLVSPLKSFPGRLAALEFVATRLTLEDPLPPAIATRSAGVGGTSGTVTNGRAP